MTTERGDRRSVGLTCGATFLSGSILAAIFGNSHASLPVPRMQSLIQRSLRLAYHFACLLVAVLSLAPGTALPDVPISDKAEHILAYAALGLLGGLAERSMRRTILELAALGLAIELLQAFSPGRSPDGFDLLADSVGACGGCILAVSYRSAIKLADRASLRRPVVAPSREATDMSVDRP